MEMMEKWEIEKEYKYNVKMAAEYSVEDEYHVFCRLYKEIANAYGKVLMYHIPKINNDIEDAINEYKEQSEKTA